MRIFDVNLRPPFISRTVITDSLELANVLKLNDSELDILAYLFELPEGKRSRMERLASQFQLDVIALTHGEQGSLLFRNGQWSDLPACPTVVCDTIGAGDAFTATLTLGLLCGRTLETINRLASEVAAFVCSQAGGTPTLPTRFREALTTAKGTIGL